MNANKVLLISHWRQPEHSLKEVWYVFQNRRSSQNDKTSWLYWVPLK